jgi:hypothetical protein
MMDDDIAELKAQIAEQDAVERRFERLEAANAELKASNAALTAEVAALKPKPVPAPKPIEPVVKISNPVQASSFIMPSDDELEQLADIVVEKYPQLGDTSGLVDYGRYRPDPKECADCEELEFSAQFKKSFRALGNMYRTEAPDHKRYVSHWIDLAGAKARGRLFGLLPL